MVPTVQWYLCITPASRYITVGFDAHDDGNGKATYALTNYVFEAFWTTKRLLSICPSKQSGFVDGGGKASNVSWVVGFKVGEVVFWSLVDREDKRRNVQLNVEG